MRPLVAALFCGLLVGCKPAADPEGRKLKVLTTILPIYCFAVNVAGDRAEVTSLLPPGADAHDFQFSPKERRLLDAADLVLINGLKMEPWLDRPLKRSGRSQLVVECAAGLEPAYLAGRIHEHGASEPHTGKHEGDSHPAGTNPHLWLDPLLAVQMVTNILVALQKADRANAPAYASNAAALVDRLLALDGEIRAGLAGLSHRSLVTHHDAFAYFARRYGLNIVGVIEEIPDVAPTPRHLANLRAAIQKQGARAVFIEPQHAGKLARQFAADLKLPVAYLDTLESGELSPGAYEEGMRRNLRALMDTLK